jgi:hypothetical protein
MRHIDRFEGGYVLFVLTQELAACGQVIIDDVENFTLDSFYQTSQDDRLRAVFDMRERYCVRAAQMEEEPECSEPDPACDLTLACTIDAAGSDHDVGNAKVLGVGGDKLLLFELGKAVCIPTQVGVLLDWAGFVQAPRLLPIAVNGERADKDKSLQARTPEARLEHVPCANDGVHERIGKRLVASPGGEMKNDGRSVARSLTVLARKQIAFEHVNSSPARSIPGERFDSGQIA